jgi:hypothetical protein
MLSNTSLSLMGFGALLARSPIFDLGIFICANKKIEISLSQKFLPERSTLIDRIIVIASFSLMMLSFALSGIGYGMWSLILLRLINVANPIEYSIGFGAGVFFVLLSPFLFSSKSTEGEQPAATN